MKSLCVYCGSSTGNKKAYLEYAKKLGTFLGKNKIRLVYGGASIGLMGAIAEAALAAGGEVIGIIPGHIADREIAHKNLTNLLIVDSMHERKALMAENADAFLALPGGFGTLDELCEIITWQQLGLHKKPIYIANVDGYFNSLLKFIDQAVRAGFISNAHRKLVRNLSSFSMLKK